MFSISNSKATSPLLLIILLIGSIQGFCEEQDVKGLSPTDYFDFVFVSDPQISPDGTKIIFVKTTVKEDASGRNSHLYIIEGNQTPRRLTQGDNDKSPQWSADGNNIAFIRSVDDMPQVFLMPADIGEAVQLTTLEDFMTGFQWFPDSQGLLLTLETDQQEKASETANDEEAKRAKPDIVVVKHARYIANGLGYLTDKRQHLYAFDIAEKSLTQLSTAANWNINTPQVSADGKYVFYSANKTGLEYEGDANFDIYRLDTVSKKVIQINSHPHTQYQPALSPDNKSIAYLHNEDYFTQTDLWLMSVSGKGLRNLTEKFDRDASTATWSADGKTLYFVTSDTGAERLFAVDVKSAETRAVVPDDKTLDNLALSPNGEFALFTMEDSVSLPELFKYDFASKQLTKLTRFNDTLLSKVTLSPAENLWFKNDKGMDVQGFLHKPINYVEGKKYPLVLNIKGGPGGMWGHRWFHENQMYTALGYAVAYVNYRGSSGYGIAHTNAVRLDYGGADYQDNMQFLDTVLSQNNWIDGNKLYLTGGSHGGFLTNWITTQTKRFRAAVTQRSVSSWISEAGTQEFTPAQMSKEFGGNLWQNFDYYWDRSPLQFADKVSTPTLIIHSDGDMITPIGQGQEWFYALKANNVPTEMVIFKGENHSLSRSGTPTNLVERLARILEWFKRHGGQELDVI